MIVHDRQWYPARSTGAGVPHRLPANPHVLRTFLRRLAGPRNTAGDAPDDNLALARMQFEHARYQDAAGSYHDLIAAGDKRALVHFEHALSLHKAGRAIEAARACARAYDLDRGLAGMDRALIDLFDLLRVEDPASAAGPGADFIDHLALANTALAVEDLAAARAHLERAHALRPDWPHVLQRLGCLDALAGRLRAADTLLRASAAQGMPPDDYMRFDPDFSPRWTPAPKSSPGCTAAKARGWRRPPTWVTPAA